MPLRLIQNAKAFCFKRTCVLTQTQVRFFGTQKWTDNPVFRHDNLKYHSFTLFHVL